MPTPATTLLAHAQDAYADALGVISQLKGEVLKLTVANDVLRGEASALRRRLDLAVEVDVSAPLQTFSYEARLSEEVGE